MSIPNFNLFNKFCFDEVNETLSHVSNYCSLNKLSSNLYIDKNISFTIQDNLLFQDDFTIQDNLFFQDDLNLLCNKCENV